MGVVPKRVTDSPAQRSGRSQGTRSATFKPRPSALAATAASLDSVHNSSRLAYRCSLAPLREISSASNRP